MFESLWYRAIPIFPAVAQEGLVHVSEDAYIDVILEKVTVILMEL